MSESRCYGYCRQSGDTQMSLDMQESVTLELAERNGKVMHRVAKETESATKVESHVRPEFARLKQELHDGDWLCVWRIDRIDRNPFRLAKTMEWLMNTGVTICSQMEGIIDMRTVHGRMMVYGQLMVCDLFISYLRDATAAGFRWRKEKGFAYAGYKVGRKRIAVQRAVRGTKTLKIDVWDKGELATIREIYRRVQEGETLSHIAEAFHAEKRKNCNGKLWAPGKKTHRRRSRFRNVNETSVRRAYNWYARIVKEGLEPEALDPTSNVFYKQNAPKEHVIAQREDVVKRAREMIATLGPRQNPVASAMTEAISEGDSELSFSPVSPLIQADPGTVV